MLFMQQSKREICILSASGSISNASLRQPATSGGNITYEVNQFSVNRQMGTARMQILNEKIKINK
jgi:hypothetical protein